MPFADELARNGLRVGEPATGEVFPLVLVLPPRQRDEARALFARAVLRAAPGGTRGGGDAERRGRANRAKRICPGLPVPCNTNPSTNAACSGARRSASGIDPDAAGRVACAGRAAPDRRWATSAGRACSRGTASTARRRCWPRICRHDLRGSVADLGAGYGYLSAQVLARCPVSGDRPVRGRARALDLARINLARAKRSGRDVAVGIPLARRHPRPCPAYDFIVSNPPFHQGRADRRNWAARSSRPPPMRCSRWRRLLLVANRHLPYEAGLAARFEHVRALAAGARLQGDRGGEAERGDETGQD